jgi:putative ABC transport system permease protein
VKGVLYLALRHALHHRGRTAILLGCIALTLFLPLATSGLVSDYERSLVARSRSTPLVAGPRGNRFDLALLALYFRSSPLPSIPQGKLDELRAEAGLLAIPLHVRFTARGYPIVATSPEYYEERGLRAERGTRPLRVGDALLGAAAAAALRLAPGESLFSDQRELYDISRPPAVKLHVAGVLAPTGGPDDGVVFVDIKTAWMLEGLAHGHDEVTPELDPRLLLGRSEQEIRLSGAFLEYQEITDENAARFHLHGDPARLPLSAILVFPGSEKTRTLLKARWNESREYQMVVPREVIDELLAFVFRVKAFLDGIALGLGLVTALLVALVVLLSARLRAGELETLARIGASRRSAFLLLSGELLAVVLAAAALAGAAALALRNAVDLPIA